MKALLLALGLASTAAVADECLTYSANITLQGLLIRETFAEQPNYEGIEEGDAAATYYFVAPHRSLCVSEGDVSNQEFAEPEVNRVQLVFTGDAQSIS